MWESGQHTSVLSPIRIIDSISAVTLAWASSIKGTYAVTALIERKGMVVREPGGPRVSLS